MKISLLAIGKTDSKEIAELAANYIKRIKHFVPFELIVLPDVKNRNSLSFDEQKRKEAEIFLKAIPKEAVVALLDEKGKNFSSKEFAGYLQKKLNSGQKNICFLIGGPYGFHESIYKKQAESVSLSKMTFSHQLIRAIFLEQVYRGLSILNNLPYHHE
jgi:23S rRNA (pseudouridine1915-N3)-methyltransferase